MKTSRPIQVRIRPAAIRENYLLARRTAAGSRAWAVIKANAYGHGQWRAVEALREVADGFALLECENAVALREAGICQPILLLEGIFSSRDVRAVVEHDISTVIHCPEQLELLLKTAPADAALSVFLKLNTGMNRLGFTAADLPAALARLRKRPHMPVTLMTHFAEADGARGVTEQLQRFDTMCGNWSGPVTLANSAAILRHPQTHRDWVRPGIMMYGASPFADVSAESLGLKPTMSFESRLIGIQTLAAGDRVGYGGTFVAERPMRIGIVACGYADGYPRHAPTGTPIAVSGRLTRTIGRVSMDMLTCDITDIPDASIDAPVTLWGQGTAGTVAADDVATAAGTIAYELFCALAPRVPVTVEAK
ncbi:alanine racemase [Dechloromonas sp.]|uniref:alanine racemase n=1 Tax=Dechloromonas sp. TaxID=1917218 RepID=UPI0012064554|nr:alanine racemase [Dechloromonas sp.]MBU3697087.1 alanine racemase [Dechloromonas sp.]TEX49085.1 MAG: alanine racemase [Rhodocyclaceae bacterium]